MLKHLFSKEIEKDEYAKKIEETSAENIESKSQESPTTTETDDTNLKESAFSDNESKEKFQFNPNAAPFIPKKEMLQSIVNNGNQFNNQNLNNSPQSVNTPILQHGVPYHLNNGTGLIATNVQIPPNVGFNCICKYGSS